MVAKPGFKCVPIHKFNHAIDFDDKHSVTSDYYSSSISTENVPKSDLGSSDSGYSSNLESKIIRSNKNLYNLSENETLQQKTYLQTRRGLFNNTQTVLVNSYRNSCCVSVLFTKRSTK